MKVRNGFVSNSSSCSYVLNGVMIDTDKLIEFLQENFYEDGDFNAEVLNFADMREEVESDYFQDELENTFDLQDVGRARTVLSLLNDFNIDIMVSNGENGVERGKTIIGFYQQTGDGWLEETVVVPGVTEGTKAVTKFFKMLCGDKVPENMKPGTIVSVRMC